MRPFLLMVVALAAASGCTTYAFVPAASAPSVKVTANGRDAAYYSIPSQSPHGDVRIVSFGIEKLTTAEPGVLTFSAVAIPTLHLRLLVTNTGSKPWTLDTREQQIDLPDHGLEPAAFVASDRAGDASSPPVLTLTFGVKRVVDLFFPLPDGMGSGDVPAFRAHVKVHTDEGDADTVTPFERVSMSVFTVAAQNETAAREDDADGYDYSDDPCWINPGFVGFGGARPSRDWGSHVYAHPTVAGRSSSGASRGGGGRRTARGGGRGGGGGGGGGGGHGRK
jgi:uncharacterized membrane protein YgcG